MHPPHPSSPAPPHLLGSSLRRSSTDRLVLGLCGGVARATGANVVAVRLGTWALAVILLPVALLGYLVTAVILPRDDGVTLIGPGERDRRDVIAAVLATLLAAPVILGAADGSLITTGNSFPVISLGTVLIGIALILGRNARPQPLAAFGSAGAPTTAGAGGYAGGAASDPFSGTTTGPYVDATETLVTDDTAVTARHGAAGTQHAPDTAETTVMPAAARPSFVKASTPTVEIPSPPGSGNDDPSRQYGPSDPGSPNGPGGPDGPDGPGPGRHDGPLAPAPASRRRGLGLPVVCCIALIPALFAVLIAIGFVDANASSWSVMLAFMAVASAAGAVAIAFRRPSYLGAGLLVILAASFGALSISVNQFGPVLKDGIGERSYRPAGADELRRPYLLGLGELTIDLRDLELARGSRTPIAAKLGFGQVRVIVPRGVRVIAAPSSELPGLTASARRTGAAARDVTGAPTIVLDIDVRGAQVDLLTGNATRVENLTVLQSSSTGFWGTEDNAIDPASDPLPPVPTP